MLSSPKRANERKWAAWVAVLVVMASGPFGCIDEFPPASRLGDHIQVIGIEAQPPQAHLGDEVTLNSLVYVPADWPHPLERLWLACVPGVGESAQACLTIVGEQIFATGGQCAAQCEDHPDPELCAQLCWAEAVQELGCDPDRDQKGCLLGISDPVTYIVPPDAFETDDEEHSIYVFLLATALSGGLGECFEVWSEQAETGQPISPTADCTLSLKQIRVLPSEEEIGKNPTLDELLFEGAPLAAPPEVNEITLDGPKPGSSDLRLEVSFEPPEKGSVYLSWFSDCGKLEFTRTFADEPKNELTPDDVGACRVYVVVRDGKGGVGWLERRLDLQL